MNELELIEEMKNWYADSVDRLGSRGFSAELSESPQGQDPVSLRFVLESSRRLGELILWSTGMAEVQLADVISGEILPENQVFKSKVELNSALNVVVEWVAGGKADA